MKFSKYLEIDELAAFMRDIADALENGGKDQLACIDDFKRIKITVKREFGQTQLKAKIKTNEVCGDPSIETGEGHPTKPKYKDLKVRMRSTFKILVKMIHEGQMPPKEAMDSFLEDSALMVTYQGYGDEFYESYVQVCNDFKAAYTSGDMDKMHQSIDALIHEKSRCHAKYD